MSMALHRQQSAGCGVETDGYVGASSFGCFVVILTRQSGDQRPEHVAHRGGGQAGLVPLSPAQPPPSPGS